MKRNVRKILIRYRARRARIPCAGEHAVVTPILDAVIGAIADAQKEFVRQQTDLNDELVEMDYEAVLAEECQALTDELLGSSFTVLQRILNFAAQNAIECSRLTAEDTGNPQRFGNKGDAYQHGTKAVGRRTKAQLINAAANYYKHRDEWGDWASLSGQSARTAVVVQSLGMTEKASDNMETASQALGASTEDLRPLLDALASWSKELQDQLCTDAGLPAFP